MPELNDVRSVQEIDKYENPEDDVEVGDIHQPLHQPRFFFGSSKPILALSLNEVRHSSG